MALTYLEYTNRVLKALNEVPLTSSDFSSAIGFHAEAKDAVNTALFDFYTFENIEWPFLWSAYTLNLTAGTTEYTRNTAALQIDWDNVRLGRRSFTAAANVPTVVGTTVTIDLGATHYFQTGDSVNIYTGSTRTDYEGDFTITVTSTTAFSYTLAATATLPSPVDFTVRSNTLESRNLVWIDYDNYRQQHAIDDANMNSTSFDTPRVITQKQDGTFIVSPVPDRTYKLDYEAFGIPAALSAYSDTSLIPAPYDQVIVDRALQYAYMFRDNMEQAAIAENRFKDVVKRMRKIYIPRQPNARAVF